MRIEDPETSLPFLPFPHPQVRAWTGFPRNSCTRDGGTGFRYFTSFGFVFAEICFPLQVLLGNLQSFLHPRSKSKSRFSGSWGLCDAQTWMRINLPRSDRLTHRSAALAPRWPRGNRDVNTPRCNKPKYASFHTFMTRGWIANLKEG